jgi:hypothetical protein
LVVRIIRLFVIRTITVLARVSTGVAGINIAKAMARRLAFVIARSVIRL